MPSAIKLGLLAACGLAAFGSYHCVHRVMTIRDKQLAQKSVLRRYK